MNGSIKFIVLGHSVLNCLISIWAAFSFFKRGQNPERGVWVVKSGFIIALALTVIIGLNSQTLDSIYQVIGETLIGMSTLVFIWTIRTTRQLSEVYSSDLPEFLTTGGPYKFVRNPFYLSYLLNYFGAAIGMSSFVLLIQSLVMSWLYYKAAKFEEKKFSQSSLQTQYKAYIKETGMFLPNPLKILRKS
jgi:protein-S-isoprenylcysteine O-methyltransferase Ste14